MEPKVAEIFCEIVASMSRMVDDNESSRKIGTEMMKGANRLIDASPGEMPKVPQGFAICGPWGNYILSETLPAECTHLLCTDGVTLPRIPKEAMDWLGLIRPLSEIIG